MTAEDLYTENWILSYEALLKGWLRSRDEIDYIASDTLFSAFRENGISFYDTSKLAIPLGIDFSKPEKGEAKVHEYDIYDTLDY